MRQSRHLGLVAPKLTLTLKKVCITIEVPNSLHGGGTWSACSWTGGGCADRYRYPSPPRHPPAPGHSTAPVTHRILLKKTFYTAFKPHFISNLFFKLRTCADVCSAKVSVFESSAWSLLARIWFAEVSGVINFFRCYF